MDANIIRELEKRNFIVHTAADETEAVQAVLGIVQSRSVGIGGSKTVKQLGLYELLTAQGNEVHWHWTVDKAHKKEERDKAIACDVYMCSANAVLTDGRIVEIDGTGNRVAGLLYGPPCVILIVGRQKICSDLDSAIARIKRDACPENARRLGMPTPCAQTNVCHDCRTSARMCNATVILEWPMRIHREFHVVLVDKDLGL